MLWTSDEQDRLLAIIRAGARQWTAKALDEVLETGRRKKPVGFDLHSAAVQQRYLGNQRQVVNEALAERYPSKARSMPCAPVNWLRHFAATDAGCYRQEPQRWLATPEGDRIVDGDDVEAFAWACDESNLASVMPEAERRCVAVNNVLMHVGFEAAVGEEDGAGRPCVSLYWPHDVVAIMHPSRPTAWDALMVLAVRQASPDLVSGKQWWWVWSREPQEADDGTVMGWGPWLHVLISTGGDQKGQTAAPVAYAGERLPFCLLQSAPPEGSWLVDQDRDIVHVVDELNVSRSNEQYVMDLQGHTQHVYQGTLDATKMAIGPDRVANVLPGESLTTIDYNAKFLDMREGRKLSLRELAVSRRQSPDAYATEPGPPLSGVSRKIANAPHEARLDELRHLLVDFEEGQLLPTIVDVVNTFSTRSIDSNLVPRMTPRTPPDFEDPEARQRRAQEALDAGWISPARAAVEAGWYTSVDEAKEAGLLDEVKAKAAAPAPFGGAPSPFAARLQAMRGPPDDEPEVPELEG